MTKKKIPPPSFYELEGVSLKIEKSIALFLATCGPEKVKTISKALQDKTMLIPVKDLLDSDIAIQSACMYLAIKVLEQIAPRLLKIELARKIIDEEESRHSGPMNVEEVRELLHLLGPNTGIVDLLIDHTTGHVDIDKLQGSIPPHFLQTIKDYNTKLAQTEKDFGLSDN